MRLVRLPDTDGHPVYAVEGAFFYTLRRMVHWQVQIGVWRGTPLDRLLGRLARHETTRIR